MAINYFTLTEGVLELHDEKLVIFDSAKKDRISNLLVTIGGVVYSVGFIIRGYKDNENLVVYTGIGLAIFFISFLIIRKDELQGIDNEIYLKDISEVCFKKGRDDTTIATITMRKNRTRKVNIENLDNLPDQFKDNLNELNIKVSDG